MREFRSTEVKRSAPDVRPVIAVIRITRSPKILLFLPDQEHTLSSGSLCPLSRET